MGFLLKISGAGNRFLLADQRWLKGAKTPEGWENHCHPIKLKFEDFTALSQADLTQRQQVLKKLLSHPPLALADGLIVLREKTLICDFYNKDGSKADMCGNAACCLAFYFNLLGLNVKEFFLGAQKVQLDLKGEVLLDKPETKPQSFTEPFSFYFIDTGVPHGVISCDDISFDKNLKSMREKAQTLRFKNIPPYKEGMNVSFYQALSNKHLKAITFERGVENFTLACGTGALAVSLTHKYKKDSITTPSHNKKDTLQKEKIQNNSIKVEMPGGSLTVEIGEQLKLSSQVKKGF